MSDYLKRYQAGEYSQVWKELVALGDQVRTEPIYSDAQAVAQETMRRARHNVELLVKGLQKLGFKFHDPSEIFVPTTKAQLKELDIFEREVGLVPLSLRAWIEQVGTVYFMGTYPRLSYYTPNSGFLDDAVTGVMGGKPQTLDLSNFPQQLDEAEAIPLEVRNMFKNFFGAFGGQMKQVIEDDKPADAPLPDDQQAISDPLVVDPYEVSVEVYQEWQEYNEDDNPFVATIAPDIFHKSNISGGGGYEIELPNAAADAILRHTEWRQMTFVEYLRLSFEWGGFPGLQDYEHRDEALLASLKEGLLPL